MKIQRPTVKNSKKIKKEIIDFLKQHHTLNTVYYCDNEYTDEEYLDDLEKLSDLTIHDDGKTVAENLDILDDCNLDELNGLDDIPYNISKIEREIQKEYFQLINYKPKFKLGDKVNGIYKFTKDNYYITKIVPDIATYWINQDKNKYSNGYVMGEEELISSEK